jgi:hypothetical protein
MDSKTPSVVILRQLTGCDRTVVPLRNPFFTSALSKANVLPPFRIPNLGALAAISTDIRMS